MSFIEKRDTYRPETGEAPFALDEIFFSRTDKRGVIQSGNFIFRRVSDYDWDALIGAPHKLIRHPDMPKAVFWLLWETIKSGNPISAYVKNLARDGLHYWVYAIVIPLEEGYLSVRIKPSSDLLETVAGEYETLRNAELNDGVSAEDSAAALLERLKTLGFDDYTAFANHTFIQELISKDEKLKDPVDNNIVHYQKMMSVATELQDATTALSQEFEAISTIPTNMRVIASRLEPSGGSISVLSQNYGEMSQEISDWFQDFIFSEDSDFANIQETIKNSLFFECIARVMNQSASQFSRERRALGETDVHGEKQRLNGIASTYTRKAAANLNIIAMEAVRITNAIAILQRSILGLSTMRVMCKIENARLPKDGESLTDIIEQLGNLQSTIETHLTTIGDLSHKIQDCASNGAQKEHKDES
ncbi:MAG: PAS domain-containing protein [Marinosulfonomonas sp.]|nr:PAS domain-containing protein [Marinosulfonomonas sp.]